MSWPDLSGGQPYVITFTTDNVQHKLGSETLAAAQFAAQSISHTLAWVTVEIWRDSDRLAAYINGQPKST